MSSKNVHFTNSIFFLSVGLDTKSTKISGKTPMLSPCPSPPHFRCYNQHPGTFSFALFAQDFMRLFWCHTTCHTTPFDAINCHTTPATSQPQALTRQLLLHTWTPCTPSPAAPKLIHVTGSNISSLKLHPKFSLLPWKDLGLCWCYMG